MAEGVLLTEDAAARMAIATRWVEDNSGAKVSENGWHPYVPDDTFPGSIAVSKTSAKWTVGTSQEFKIFTGAPPGEAEPTKPRTVTAWNRMADIESGRWVLIGQAHLADDGTEVWYLLSTELTKTEVVKNVECVNGKMVITKGFVWTLPEAA
jgi:hypothetical protein